ncbi:hypothetical protein M0R45_031086 [Rubus argutus]|uniref:Uncharacterized protein n=1 Tax=Rubus argutus TaxID=59490 RepID=A0AAW1WFC5_RUBAR
MAALPLSPCSLSLQRRKEREKPVHHERPTTTFTDFTTINPPWIKPSPPVATPKPPSRRQSHHHSTPMPEHQLPQASILTMSRTSAAVHRPRRLEPVDHQAASSNRPAINSTCVVPSPCVARALHHRAQQLFNSTKLPSIHGSSPSIPHRPPLEALCLIRNIVMLTTRLKLI